MRFVALRMLLFCLLVGLPATADEALELYQQMVKTRTPLTAAEQAYERALAAASTPAQRFPVLFVRASYLVDCQEFARAEPLAREALELGEGDARRDASVLLGRVLTGLGRWREAEQAIVAGARPGPPEKDLYACEAACKLALDQGHYPRAETLVRRYNPTWSRVVIQEFILLTGEFQHRQRQPLQADWMSARDHDPAFLEEGRRVAAWRALTGDTAGAVAKLRSLLPKAENIAGSEHPLTANIMHDLAELLPDKTEAQALARRVVDIREATLGPQHWRTGQGRLLLAKTTSNPAEAAVAERILQASLGPEHPFTLLAGLETDRRRLPEFLDRLGKLLLPGHPVLLRLQNELLQHQAVSGRPDLALARRQLQGQMLFLDDLLYGTCERERLAAAQALRPFGWLPHPALREAVTHDLVQQALRTKGLVLESMVESLLAARSHPEAAQRAQEIMMWRHKATVAEMTGDPLVGTVTGLRDGAEMLLACNLPMRRLASQGPQPEEVQRALPPRSALLDFVRLEMPGTSEERYAVAVTPSAGNVRWLDLGPAAQVDDVVLRCQRALRGRGEAAPMLREAYQTCLAPALKVLPPGTDTLLVSPDGQLNFVPFAVLLDGEHFAAERFLVLSLNTGRDILKRPLPSANRNALVLGNPAYGQAQGVASASDRGMRALRFSDLPGAAQECQDLARLLAGYKVELLLGAQATESRMRRLAPHQVKRVPGVNIGEPRVDAEPAPRILHLATHGYFLPPLHVTEKVVLQDPRARSGVALSGAQTTLTTWKAGNVTDPDDDGIFTAEDVLGLDLRGTWLVVLSACDTGSGEAVRGEGVLGLRRAFVEAGAQNLLMTLWPVSDELTRQLMLDFYRRALADNDAPRALALAQRDCVARLRKEKGIDAAARLAGPFVLVFQGPVK